jgi:hypothetical protein
MRLVRIENLIETHTDRPVGLAREQHSNQERAMVKVKVGYFWK